MNEVDNKQDKIMRTAKSVVAKRHQTRPIDGTVVKKKFYNAFNYTKMPREYKHKKLTIGVTSPSQNEGKTLVASNLAVSFALGYQRKTVIVDFNIKHPHLHEVFGVDIKPGLTESLRNGHIELYKTEIPELFVLPAGEIYNERFEIGLSSLVPIRDVIYSLEQEFDFVVVDMSSVFPVEDFPALLANEVDGLMVVVDVTKTKQTEIDKIFRQIDKNQMIGFVLNKVEEND